MRFNQADGFLMGGSPVTHVTEPICLDMGEHWDIIHFVVIPKMTETVILGLAWLDKWRPTIWWENGVRTLRLVTGPLPPSETSQIKRITDAEGGGELIELLRATMDQTLSIQLILMEYWEVAIAFSKEDCDILSTTTTTKLLIVRLKYCQGLNFQSIP